MLSPTRVLAVPGGYAVHRFGCLCCRSAPTQSMNDTVKTYLFSTRILPAFLESAILKQQKQQSDKGRDVEVECRLKS